MITPNNKQVSLVYSDDNILAEIWKAIRQYEEIRALGMDSFSISVLRGFVLLSGHVSKKYHRDLVEEIACSQPGVHAVQNKLVVDSDLTLQIAGSLAKDVRTLQFILPVGCSHGWIRLGGEVPSHEVQLAAEEIAGQVPFVRGVLSRPKVIGENPETERRAIQPRIKSKIYDYNRQEGVVTHVVIEPRSRLVTHAVASVSDFHDGKSVVHEYLIPVEAMEVVNQENIILKRNRPPLNAYPRIELSNYPLAPDDWQPPYPYELGFVRWTCEQ
ncbi:MAG: BON domain-containing protein [Chloroflexi bacterium]|nr:BON domain-containing protein [Chloroflexota bacterium]